MLLLKRIGCIKCQVLPISIESFNMRQSLLQALKTLKEYINQCQENRKLLEMKEKAIKEPTFNTFLSSYVVDVIVFATGILSVILTFVIMYMLCGQSKLKIRETENCNFELMQLLIILNLVVTVLLVFNKLKEE